MRVIVPHKCTVLAHLRHAVGASTPLALALADKALQCMRAPQPCHGSPPVLRMAMSRSHQQNTNDTAQYCIARFDAVLEDLVGEKIDPSYILGAIAKLARTVTSLDPEFEVTHLESLSASLRAKAEVACACASLRG